MSRAREFADLAGSADAGGITGVNITSAQYVDENDVHMTIKATIDGKEVFVPLDPANRHYDEIMKQVAAGDLTIQDAD